MTAFYSPVSGTITAFESHEGEYVAAKEELLYDWPISLPFGLKRRSTLHNFQN